LKKKIKPPFVPKQSNDDKKAPNFDNHVTNEKVGDTFAVNVKNDPKYGFDDFDFYGK